MSELEERIVKLAKVGISRHAIADETGASVHTVYHVISRARGRGVKIPRGTHGRPRTASLSLPPQTVKELGVDAAMRGLTTAELALRIIDTCAKQRLVTAVLDDGEVRHD